MAASESTKLPARVWRDLIDSHLAFRSEERLGALTVPSLLVWGDHDAIFPRAEQEVLCRKIPGARFLCYEGTGHAVHWEEPDRFAGDILRFLDQGALAQGVRRTKELPKSSRGAPISAGASRS
jgi:pimeloyl-ACP methyl ester carboxylesterase